MGRSRSDARGCAFPAPAPRRTRQEDGGVARQEVPPLTGAADSGAGCRRRRGLVPRGGRVDAGSKHTALALALPRQALAVSQRGGLPWRERLACGADCQNFDILFLTPPRERVRFWQFVRESRNREATLAVQVLERE